MRNLLLLFTIGVLGGCASNKPVTCTCKCEPTKWDWDRADLRQFYVTPYKIPLDTVWYSPTTDSVIFLP